MNRGRAGLHPQNKEKLSPMWIVRLALRRPYTFVVMRLAIAIMPREGWRRYVSRVPCCSGMVAIVSSRLIEGRIWIFWMF